MRKVGRIYSAHVSGTALVAALIFAIVFAVVSVWAINQYVYYYFQNRALSAQVAELSKKLNGYQYQSKVLDQYDELANDLHQPVPAAESEVTPVVAAADPTAVLPAPPEEALSGAETAETEATPETTDNADAAEAPEPEKEVPPPADPPVDVDRLALRPEKNNTAVKFQYTLQKVAPGNDAVSGYLFIVLADQKTSKLVPYPAVEMKEGAPADYKKGRQFSIRYENNIQGTVDKLTNAGDFTQAWVFAFSEKGELLMKKLLSSQNG